MSDLAALEILASINKLASEIKSINPPVETPIWKQPWIGAVVGVGIGFSLTFFKEIVSNKSLKKNKKKCIDYEVQDIRHNAALGIKFCVEFYNEFDKVSNKRIQLKLPTDSLTLCFEKYYADVVIDLPHKKRTALVKIYKHLGHYSDVRDRYVKNAGEKALNNIDKKSYVDVLILAFAHVYHSSKQYEYKDYTNDFSVKALIEELGLKADFIARHEDNISSNKTATENMS
ncbi:hypothetical protein F4826_001111 [Rahnella inusitata]|nr:hypothetical protein [Rahnella inusitata]